MLYSKKLLITLFFIQVTWPAIAEQNLFNKTELVNEINYVIGYKDPSTNTFRNVTFALNKERITNARNSLHRIKDINKDANTRAEILRSSNQSILNNDVDSGIDDVLAKLKRDANIVESRFPKGTTVKVVRSGQRFDFHGNLTYDPNKENPKEIRARFKENLGRLDKRADYYLQKLQQRIEQRASSIQSLHDQDTQDYYQRKLANSYFQLGDNELLFDYGRAVRDSKRSLQNLASNFVAHKTITRQVAQLAYFFQSIPYKAIGNQDRFSAGGVILPEVVLDSNIGDCDSKSIAMASALLNLNPNLKMHFVIIPKHALLAIELPAALGETTISHKGTTYMLFETAGPGLTPPGYVYPNTRTAIDNNQYKLIKLN